MDELSLISALIAGVVLLWWWPAGWRGSSTQFDSTVDPLERAESALNSLQAQLLVATDIDTALKEVGWQAAGMPVDVAARIEHIREVGLSYGVSASLLIDELAADVQRRREIEQRWESSAAGASSTSVTLMFLPLVMWALAESLGTHAAMWLVTSPIGWACIALGVGLTVCSRLALTWLRRSALVSRSQKRVAPLSPNAAANWAAVAVLMLKTDALGLCLAVVIRMLVLSQWQKLGREPASQAGAEIGWASVALAAALEAGLDWVRAVRVAADAVDIDLKHQLESVAQRLEWGVDPAHAFESDDFELDAISTAIAQTHRSGAPVSAALLQAARSATAARHADALKRVEHRAALAVVPVTALQLPAFVVLGLAPVVVTQLMPLLSAFSSTRVLI